MDLFDQTQPNEQDDLREAMQRQYEHDAAVIRADGRIPDWFGEPRPLEKSLARVLNYAYEQGPFQWTNQPSANNRRLTSAFGFRSPINAQDAVNRCYKDGLLEFDKSGVYYLAQAGEYALEEWHLEAEVAGMDVFKALAPVDEGDEEDIWG
jgi:hypothetical protein